MAIGMMTDKVKDTPKIPMVVLIDSFNIGEFMMPKNKILKIVVPMSCKLFNVETMAIKVSPFFASFQAPYKPVSPSNASQPKDSQKFNAFENKKFEKRCASVRANMRVFITKKEQQERKSASSRLFIAFFK